MPAFKSFSKAVNRKNSCHIPSILSPVMKENESENQGKTLPVKKE